MRLTRDGSASGCGDTSWGEAAWFPSATTSMGDREYFRPAGTCASASHGLRKVARDGGGHDLRCEEPANAAQVGDGRVMDPCPLSTSYSRLQNSLAGRRLLSWAAVANVPGLRECLERLFHGHQRRCLDRGQGATCRDSKHDPGQRDVVRCLEDRVAVVFAEAIPEAVQGAPHLFDVRARCIAAIFRVLH